MRLLQILLFAFFCQVPTLVDIHLLHDFYSHSLCLPRFHFPFWRWEYRVCWGRRSGFIHSRWSSHCRLICIQMDFRDASPALFSTLSLLTLSLQDIAMIDLTCLIMYACSLSSLHTVYSPCHSTVQQSSQHSGSVDLALHSYGNVTVILILTFIPSLEKPKEDAICEAGRQWYFNVG